MARKMALAGIATAITGFGEGSDKSMLHGKSWAEGAQVLIRVRIPTGAIVVVYGVYLWLACLHLQLPGLQYDEVLFANAALGNPDGSFLEFSCKLGGIQVPIMLMKYIGALKAWLYYFIFKVLPTSPTVVRFPMIAVGLLALVFTYMLVRRVFDQSTGIVACALMATDPAFIFHVREDWGPVAIMMALKMGSLYCLTHCVERDEPVWLGSSGFLLGLGLFDKANFIWYVAALPIAALAVWRRDLLARVSRRNLLVLGAFFLVGSCPLLIYNLRYPGATVKGQLRMSPAVSASLLHDKAILVIETLEGKHPYGYILQENLPRPARAPLAWLVPDGTLTPWLLLAALLGVAVNRELRRNRTLVFFVLLSTVILVQIYLTYQATGGHHVMMLYPFPQIIIASALCACLRAGSARQPQFICWRTLYFINVIILAAALASNVIVDRIYHRSVLQTGGKGIWSDAIYALADYAEAHNDRTYLLTDWGFNTQLLLLSRGRIKKTELLWELLRSPKRDAEIERVYRYASDPASVFVFHAQRYVVFPETRQIFEEMLQRYGLQARLLKVFRQRDGESVYMLEDVVFPPSPRASCCVHK